jgi:cell division cycle 20-like protein 1 (cofactor of APC complex)
LKWSPDRQLLASGGNDNRLLVWNQSCINPIQIYTDHTAAVKAIAWSPHQQGLLASGGGTADRYIRFWNTLTAQSLQCIDTGSQVKIIINQTFHLIVKHDRKGVLNYKGKTLHSPL